MGWARAVEAAALKAAVTSEADAALGLKAAVTPEADASLGLKAATSGEEQAATPVPRGMRCRHRSRSSYITPPTDVTCGGRTDCTSRAATATAVAAAVMGLPGRVAEEARAAVAMATAILHQL